MNFSPPIVQKPTRKLIVSDPGKLTYFARANAVRAGTAGTWGGAFGGIESDHSPSNQPTASSSGVKLGGSLQTVGDFFGQLGRGLLDAGPPAPTYVASAPPPDNTGLHVAIGLGAAVVVGLVVWKVAKKM